MFILKNAVFPLAKLFYLTTFALTKYLLIFLYYALKKTATADFNNPLTKVCNEAVANLVEKIEQMGVYQPNREKWHIDQGNKEIIAALVKCHMAGRIRETRGGSIEDLMAATEEKFCFEHNKQGTPTKLDDNTIVRYFKDAEKKILQEKTQSLKSTKNKR